MKRKMISLLLTSAMVLSMMSMGVTASAEEESATDYWSAWEDVDTSEHVVINYMTTGDRPTGEAEENLNAMLDELNAILTEKVNAEIEIYYIEWTDYLSNYNLTLASMDGSVDLVGSSTDWLDAWPNAKNGAFLELSEEMLSTYAPATWASISDESWEACTYDGDIYFIPEDNYAQWTNHGFSYRLDWAREAGLEDGVNSWADMTTYFAYVIEAYGDELLYAWNADGTQYATMVGGWITSNTNYISIDGINTGAMWGGTSDDPYTIYSPYLTETDLLVEFAEMMKEWDEMGVWMTDVLNNTDLNNRDEFRVGQVAAEQHHTQTWTDLCSATDSNTIYETDEDAEVGFFYFGEESGNLVSLSVTHGVMAVSAASENPERALMVYDLLRNDETCYRLFNYGIEGVSYEITEDGYKTTPESYDSETQNIAGMVNFWWGRNDDLELKNAEYNWDAIEELYAEYDEIAIPYQYSQYVADIDEISYMIDNISEIHTNYMKQIAYGKYTGTAEEIVAEYQQALLDAGIEDVTAAIQEQINETYGLE
ncbi:MAG: ABC transporter substrate-binding protein [Lachnospiraceae bacterium]|nr:ABC transporter substrate-binding protein [Lachnospiraceae bacterium]